jgi:hypothetical protein
MLGEDSLQGSGVSFLGFSGKNGEFSINKKKLKVPVDIVMLGVKKKLGAWTPGSTYFSNEFSSYDEMVSLKCSSGAQVRTLEESISAKDLKAKEIPELGGKLRESFILYVLYDGEIYKLDVHGKSSSELIGFYSTLNEIKDSAKVKDLNELTLSLNSEEFIATNGDPFFKITFSSKGPHADSKLVEEKTAELSELFGGEEDK